MELKIFQDIDFTDFWADTDYQREVYIEDTPDDALISSVEYELGYKLPASYIELMKTHNGGKPKNFCYPVPDSFSGYVSIAGFKGIGRNKYYSLCGDISSQFMIDEWGYPNTGVYICDCPSAGHDMIMLDYEKCGKDGEPEVIHIDQESDYKKTFVAKDFETFVRGLVHEDVYDTTEADLLITLSTLQTGQFSEILKSYFKAEKTTDFDKILRNLLTEIAEKKRYLALHADELSHLAYDLQFYLLSRHVKITSKQDFLRYYPELLAMTDSDISTNGYAEDFVEDWFDEKLENKSITKGLLSGYTFTDRYKEYFFDAIKQYAD